MIRLQHVLILCLCFAGCTRNNPPPWHLMVLGEGSVAESIEHEWVMAETQGKRHWLQTKGPHDRTKLSRDLKSMPDIACGDVMRISPLDFPLSIQHALGWGDLKDSIVVTWHCLDRGALAALHRQSIDHHPNKATAFEKEWIELLQLHHPNSERHEGERLKMGDEITLSVTTVRADAIPMEPETVKLTFHLGDSDQVVSALQPGLNIARTQSTWSVWATSASAFGQEAHPELELPAHMPLWFSATVE